MQRRTAHTRLSTDYLVYVLGYVYVLPTVKQLHAAERVMDRSHHVTNMDMGRLLSSTGRTDLPVSLTVSPGFFCLWSVVFSIVLGNLLRGILFKCCNLFFFYYSCNRLKLELY